jgi:hypothetical protein
MTCLLVTDRWFSTIKYSVKRKATIHSVRLARFLPSPSRRMWLNVTAAACVVWSPFVSAQVPALSLSPSSHVNDQIAWSNVKPVIPADAYRLLMSVLRLQSFSVAENKRKVRVVPGADTKLQGETMGFGYVQVSRDQVITTIFGLHHKVVTNPISILHLISHNNTRLGYGYNNFITTHHAENVAHLARSSSGVPGQSIDYEPSSLWSFSTLKRREKGIVLMLALLGVMLSVPFISAFTGCEKKLRTEAERLARLLTLAYQKVQLTGQTIVWEADHRGYRFLRQQSAQRSLVTDDRELRARKWLVLPMQLHPSTALSLSSESGRLQLALEHGGAGDSFLLVLAHGDCSATVQGDGLGNFRADD